MTVSNPATLSSVKAEFGGPGNLAAYVRGGSYVPSNASSSISTTVAGLALSQFNGVTKPPSGMTATVNSTTPSGGGGNKGTYNLSPVVTITPSGGSGSYTYSTATMNSSAGQSVSWSCSQAGASYTFRVTLPVNISPTGSTSVWTIGVSDGTTTVNFTIDCSFN